MLFVFLLGFVELLLVVLLDSLQPLALHGLDLLQLALDVGVRLRHAARGLILCVRDTLVRGAVCQSHALLRGLRKALRLGELVEHRHLEGEDLGGAEALAHQHVLADHR